MNVKAHPLFAKDVKRLDKKDKERLLDAIQKIKENPTRYKPVTGIPYCYRARFGNLRIVYLLRSSEIWIVIVAKRKNVYKEMKQRI
ncbi:MAG: type II toxin-antitoxin system RelE family toxin [Candidatus Methanospirareceae archaeon]